jgi:NAD(P)-dependent dehydrogenase (short-subunit alcohol dehydrogenase family)
MTNPFSLENKNILITGAASGIGRQCAVSCEALGANLILFDLNGEGLNDTLNLLERKESHFKSVIDLIDYEGTSKAVSDAVANCGKISGVLHCAGISTTLPLKMATPEILDKFFRVNVYIAYFLTKEVCKMNNLSKEGASIVFFSSVVGSFGESGKSIYGMTKGALLAGAKSLAVELAKKNVRVNTISPGVIITPININLPHIADPERRAALENQHLLGLGETTDVANACIYLLSDASRWVTGTNLFVDGGYTTR